jgi:hypothetical protein
MDMRVQILVVTLLAAVFITVFALFMTSVCLQLSATQTFDMSQQLFPALEAAGYDYWLDFGTLLGAEREQTMIAHDYDADIGMREPEFQRLKANWDQNPLFAGMRLELEKEGLYKVRRGLAYIDIFRYDDSQPGVLHMISQGNTDHKCACNRKGHSMPASHVYPLKRQWFGTITAPTPAQSDVYLAHWYGPDWRVPKRTQGKARKLSMAPLWWRKR